MNKWSIKWLFVTHNVHWIDAFLQRTKNGAKTQSWELVVYTHICLFCVIAVLNARPQPLCMHNGLQISWFTIWYVHVNESNGVYAKFGTSFLHYILFIRCNLENNQLTGQKSARDILALTNVTIAASDNKIRASWWNSMTQFLLFFISFHFTMKNYIIKWCSDVMQPRSNHIACIIQRKIKYVASSLHQ